MDTLSFPAREPVEEVMTPSDPRAFWRQIQAVNKNPFMFQQVMFLPIGMPGSGKTSFRDKYLPNVKVISPDVLIEQEAPYHWSQNRAEKAWEHCEWLLSCTTEGPIFFDACFVGDLARARILSIANNNDFRVVGIQFDTTRELYLARNITRPEGRRLPQEKMEVWEALHAQFPPKVEEGFWSLWNLKSWEEVACSGHSYYDDAPCYQCEQGPLLKHAVSCLGFVAE